MNEAEVRALQERLKAAGYNVAVDGRMGPATQAAMEKFNASQAAVQSKQADARAEEARAAAEMAKADAAKAKADAEKSAAEAAERQSSSQRSAEDAKRLFDTSVTAGAYAIGAVSGALTAKKLDKLHGEGQAAKNKALKRVATEARPLIDKADGKTAAGKRSAAKLGAIVRTADKAGLTSTRRGVAGPVAGGGLVLVGLASRAIAAETENETVKTVLNATGTAEAVAGGVVLVKDMANRASTTHLPDVKSLATIEQARAVSHPGMPAEPKPKPTAPAATPPQEPKASKPGKPPKGGSSVLGAAKKLVLPLIAGIAGHTAFSKSAAAGESTGKALGEAAQAAGEATADVLTGGAVSTFAAAKADGKSGAIAAVEAVVTGVANVATLGAAGLVASKVAARETIPYVPESVARRRSGAFLNDAAAARAREAQVRPAGAAAPAHGKAYIDGAAERRASEAARHLPLQLPGTPGAARPAAQAPQSDGQTEGYTRVDPRTGMTVQVQGYRTPKK